jgi:hypothetical protein
VLVLRRGSCGVGDLIGAVTFLIYDGTRVVESAWSERGHELRAGGAAGTRSYACALFELARRHIFIPLPATTTTAVLCNRAFETRPSRLWY